MHRKRLIFMILGLVLVCGVGVFGVIQLIPYGKAHQNPPVVQEPAWDSPQTRALAQRACFDCHSNETIWPWYSNIAPVSWLVQRDVDEGRAKVNFSEWGQRRQETDDLIKVLRKGSMPPNIYLVQHPDAGLTAQEKTQLMSGFQNTFGSGK